MTFCNLTPVNFVYESKHAIASSDVTDGSEAVQRLNSIE